MCEKMVRLNRLLLKNIADIQILKVAIFNYARKSLNSIPNHSDITTYNHRILFKVFVYSWYLIRFFICFIVHLKRRFFCPLGVSSTWNYAETLRAETHVGHLFVVLIASYKINKKYFKISTIYECVE